MARTSFLGAAVGAAGVVVGGWFRWNQRRSRPAAWVPARSRAGDPGFSEKARTQESRDAPAPWVRGRSFPLARFGVGRRIVRSWGYYGAHLRALIWDAFSCGADIHRLPLGKLSPKVTDEGATGFAQRGRRKSLLRRQSGASFSTRKGWVPNRLSSAPQCAHWGTFPRGEGFGVEPCRVSSPLPSNGLARRAHPAGPGGSP